MPQNTCFATHLRQLPPARADSAARTHSTTHAPTSVVVLLALVAHGKYDDQIGHLVIFIESQITSFAS